MRKKFGNGIPGSATATVRTGCAEMLVLKNGAIKYHEMGVTFLPDQGAESGKTAR